MWSHHCHIQVGPNGLQFWQSCLQIVLDIIHDLCPLNPECIRASDWALLVRLSSQTPIIERTVHGLFYPPDYKETKEGHSDGFLGALEPVAYRAAYDTVRRSPNRVFPDANVWLSLAQNRGKFVKELILQHVRR